MLARAVPAISSSMRSAYGRIASIRACARRSFAAATSSIARVILRVFRTERIRRLMSWTEDIYAAFSPVLANRVLTLSISAPRRSPSSSEMSPASRISL